MISLYDFQQEAKAKINDYYSAGIKKVLMQMPTGAGKTVVIYFLINTKCHPG